MERLTQHAIAFIDAQVTAGARAFQLFDSWAGSLSRRDYDTFVLPHSRRVFDAMAAKHPGVPGIHFGIGCDHLLESMLSAGPRVLGLDWRTSISDARTRMGSDLIVQGNLDPALVLAGRDPALRGAARVLADNGGHDGHIFNLGHGVDPPPTRRSSKRSSPTSTKARDADMTTVANNDKTAVLLMAYGTPRTPDEIEPYYTDIRRGRPRPRNSWPNSPRATTPSVASLRWRRARKPSERPCNEHSMRSRRSASKWCSV